MPELPEVERAAALVRTIATGKLIKQVDTVDDLLVYSGISHSDFGKELTGRTVLGAKRYGKLFYVELDGEGKLPVLHFGMTGMLQVKGQLATYYKETPRSPSQLWPPKFMKFVLHLQDPKTQEIIQLAFLDARRLGRIRLCVSPLEEPPISQLGFDPILSMPSLEDFKAKVLKRSCPIKALLLDQSFSAGVGNWVAENWLMKHRWGKGKKKHEHTLKLPSGEPATIKWLTVGGRTSAFVEELQILSRADAAPEDESPEEPPLKDADAKDTKPDVPKRKRPTAPEVPLPRRSSSRLAERKVVESQPSTKKRSKVMR
ncbi:hypothetical protein ONZ45_g15302 [Pleurotus djamor]|nr:hypothetical protein ONZ45_g15302 [Pleurotus djamor]